MPPFEPVGLAQALIKRRSVTPADDGALDVLQDALRGLGFTCERMPFGGNGRPRIDNLWARRGTGAPLVYVGHTDVVPPGDERAWTHPPFAAEIADGYLWGRGAIDMKGGIASFVSALARFLDRTGTADLPLGLLVTGDEEGAATDGTRPVVAELARRGERFAGFLVGEPTCPERLGDMIKIGRRGSFTATLTTTGRQGHVAYPHLADNPLPRLVRMLDHLASLELDRGSEHFDPSSLQITTIDVGNPAANVIPASGSATFNIRFNDRHDGRSLEALVRRALDAVGGAYELTVMRTAESFLTPPGPLSDAVGEAIRSTTGLDPVLSTTGGTSDARFVRAYGPVVELGHVNRTIHQVDERVALLDLAALSTIYDRVLCCWFGVGDAR